MPKYLTNRQEISSQQNMGKDKSQMNKSSGKQMKRCTNWQVVTMNMQITVTAWLSLYTHQTDKN